jgi:hypothetical protein
MHRFDITKIPNKALRLATWIHEFRISPDLLLANQSKSNFEKLRVIDKQTRTKSRSKRWKNSESKIRETIR